MCGFLGSQALLAGCGGGGSESVAQAATSPVAGDKPIAAPAPIVPAAPDPTPAPVPASTPAPASAPASAPTSAPAPTPAPSPTPAPAPATWALQDSLAIVIGSATTVDLRPTLPSGLASGGRFEVDAGGSPLPGGVSLSADGLLSVAANAAAGVTVGVVFAYIEP
jgi:hypothetical protein